MQQELARLRDGADVLVATPSGLFSQLQQGTIDLRTSLEMLVVDEADLVLSYGTYYYYDTQNTLYHNLPDGMEIESNVLEWNDFQIH